MDQFRVSQSKVKLWRKCHRAFHYKYVEEIVKVRKSRPLQFGKMVHEALETYFNGDEISDYFDGLREDIDQMSLFAQERDEYGDILQDCEDIVTDYMEYWGDDSLRPIRIAKKGAEHQFEIEVLPDVIWNGRIDMLAKTLPDKRRWLVEHKTYARKPNTDDRWRNLQSSTYFHAMEILGWPLLDGVLWDYIKSKPPATPGILKSGNVSSKRIDTLPSKIRRDYPDHERLMTIATENRENYFERVFTPVHRSVVGIVFKDFISTIREMIEGYGKKYDMNIDRHCSWCDYEPLCRAHLENADVDYIKEREYTHAPKKEEDDSKIHKASDPITF